MVLGSVGRVAAQGFAGGYRAGPSQTVVQVSTWGEDCGPRPQSATDSSRPTVQVKAQGTHLALAFPDRTLTTNGCWSPNVTVRVVSSTATASKWKSECRTPEGEAKREHGVYTVTAGPGGTLDLLEESAYDWQLKSSHCVAKVRVTQRLVRIGSTAEEDEREEREEKEQSESTRCTPGPLTRLKLRPREAKLAPGERICFAVRGFDAGNCRAVLDPSAVKWTLTKPGAALATLSNGCFRAATTAAEAEGRFGVSVSQGGLHAEAFVTVASTDLSDITARRGSSTSEPGEESIEDGIASALGIEAAVKGSSAGTKIAVIVALLSVLGGVAWVVARKIRKRPSSADDEDDASGADEGRYDSREIDMTASQPRVVAPAAPAAPAEPHICPTCRRGFAASVARCPNDGSATIPYSEFVRRARASQAQPSHCPACGAQLEQGAIFCGKCGARVSP